MTADARQRTPAITGDTDRPLVLVGKRRAATRAARKLGFVPVVIHERPRSEQARSAYGGSASLVEQHLAALGGPRPAAIIAVAEGAVPAAAQARARYGLRGLSPEVAARCHDKGRMKAAVVAAGVPCAQAILIDEQTSASELVDELGLPVVLKVPISSGGRGVHLSTSEDDLRAHMRPGLLAERFTHGVEMSVETLLFEGRAVFRNHTRYLEPRWANLVPASLGRGEGRAVDALVDRVHAALGIDHGITHVELFLTEEGPVFGEIAARPPGGHLMELMALAYGFDPWEALLRLELGAPAPLPARALRHAGAILLHPGPGVLDEVSGLAEARALLGVERVRCSVEPGDRVRPRLGTGESVGEIIVTADDGASCAARLRRARGLVELRLR